MQEANKETNPNIEPEYAFQNLNSSSLQHPLSLQSGNKLTAMEDNLLASSIQIKSPSPRKLPPLQPAAQPPSQPPAQSAAQPPLHQPIAQPTNQELVPARITRCPDCNSLLHISYSCTGFTVAWSIFLLVGLTCWVPCVVDACKRSQAKCITCDRVIQTYEPSCC